MIRTFIDTGILFTAVKGDDPTALPAIEILDDPNREFASSRFIELEALPKAAYYGHLEQLEFYESFFKDSVTHWPKCDLEVIKLAGEMAKKYGLNALDSLHISAAVLTECREFYTTEKPTKPFFKVKELRILSLNCKKAPHNGEPEA